MQAATIKSTRVSSNPVAVRQKSKRGMARRSASYADGRRSTFIVAFAWYQRVKESDASQAAMMTKNELLDRWRDRVVEFSRMHSTLHETAQYKDAAVMTTRTNDLMLCVRELEQMEPDHEGKRMIPRADPFMTASGGRLSEP
jgi:hypothetical protein